MTDIKFKDLSFLDKCLCIYEKNEPEKYKILKSRLIQINAINQQTLTEYLVEELLEDDYFVHILETLLIVDIPKSNFIDIYHTNRFPEHPNII